MSSARFRLASDISMKVAGRKIVESTSTPLRAGFRAARAASTSRVTWRVLPSGCFSTMRSSPGPPLMTPSPIGGWNPSTTSATSARRRTVGSAERGSRTNTRADGHQAEVCRRLDRRRVRDGHPLVGTFDEPAGGHRHRIAGGRHDVLQRDAVGAEPIRIDQHLQLPVALSPDGHVGDSGDGHQSRTHRPARERRQVDLRQRSPTTCRSSSPG